MRDPLIDFPAAINFWYRRVGENFSHVTTTSAYSLDQCLFHYYRDFTTVADRGDNRFVKPVAA